MRNFLIALTFSAAACGFALSQTAAIPAIRLQPPTGKSGEPIEAQVVVGSDGRPVPVGRGGPGGGAPKAAAESPRLARLKTLTFDRRPSAVLKKWAPEAKPDPNKVVVVKDPAVEALDKEILAFQKAVALGEWAQVKAYLASLPDEEAIAGYKQMLQSLQQSPQQNMQGNPEMMEAGFSPVMMQVPGAQQYVERNRFSVDDLFGLIGAIPTATNVTHFDARAALIGPAPLVDKAPKGIQDKEHLAAFTAILREVVLAGALPEVVVQRFKLEAAKPATEAILTKRQLAKLLILGNQAAYAGDFLPTPEVAQKENDLEGLNLLSRHFLALNLKEQKTGNLEKSWNAVQAVLAVSEGKREELEEALLRAVELAPKVADKLGQDWLDESFTKKQDRGMAILANVGTLVSQGISTRPMDVEGRHNTLKLMKTAVEALMKAAPDKAKEWKTTLTLLAAGWLKEAEFSRQYDRSTNPRLQRDPYGNIYYGQMMNDEDDMMNRMMMQQPNMPRPITVGDVLRARPSNAWVASVDDSLRPKLADVLARLHLKASEEDKAFPLIEELVKFQPNEAKELVREFIRVWTKNHDPNGNRNQNRYSWFFFGFEQRAEGIPLTRSKQERNLTELAGWVARIRKLPGGGELDDELLVKAFTNCHSSAEVYKTEAIETVFGPLSNQKPRTLAGLAQQMRSNLAGLWREPSEQEKKKTNRKKKDLEAEVLRGYAVAEKAVNDGLAKFPNHWALLAAKASLLHDEVNYRQDLSKGSDFTARRSMVFNLYALAAAEYAKVAKAMPEDERTNDVFDQWFAASLGAVDLSMITEEKQPAPKEPARIKAALQALPGEIGQKQMDRFANDLFTRMSGAKPHVKFNYLKAGFEIVGEHKQAVEAKKLFDYYKDLVREIKLVAEVDGSTSVGHGRPFGVFVNLHHTRDIERESGGFGRYLQNQNSSGYFSYNYGRPTADYRERFENTAKEALKEHFEVISVTFQDEKVNSRALPEFGWRYTPYAYLLLKPRGPQVDAIPPLRLDLDFLDTSGYVVLPVNTPKVPIDCRSEKGEARPVSQLTVTQILDERQAEKGVLVPEVKAVGVGLVPPMEDLLTVAPEGFDIDKVDDQGLAVKKFDENLERNAIVSERNWAITLKGKSGQSELPKTFTFASVKVETKEKLYQRYNDSDLAAVEEVVPLDKVYGKTSRMWYWIAGAGALLVVAFVGLLIWIIGKAPKVVATGPQLPTDLTAFSVLELLRGIKKANDLSTAQKGELDQTIDDLERYYFSEERSGSAPDLRKIALKWVGVRG